MFVHVHVHIYIHNIVHCVCVSLLLAHTHIYTHVHTHDERGVEPVHIVGVRIEVSDLIANNGGRKQHHCPYTEADCNGAQPCAAIEKHNNYINYNNLSYMYVRMFATTGIMCTVKTVIFTWSLF